MMSAVCCLIFFFHRVEAFLYFFLLMWGLFAMWGAFSTYGGLFCPYGVLTPPTKISAGAHGRSTEGKLYKLVFLEWRDRVK